MAHCAQLLALPLLLAACTTPAPDHSDQTARNIALAQKAFDTFNAHDWTAHANCFSDSCQDLDPSLGDRYVVLTRQRKRQKYQELNAWSPDIKDSITSIFGSGDKVSVQFISSGTARTDSTAQQWRLPICTVFTIRDSLIVRDETYYDR